MYQHSCLNFRFAAQTATAPSQQNTKSAIRKNDCKIVTRNPNLVNIYLDKKMRLSNHHGNDSYERILEPIVNELAIQRKNVPDVCQQNFQSFCLFSVNQMQVSSANQPCDRNIFKS